MVGAVLFFFGFFKGSTEEYGMPMVRKEGNAEGLGCARSAKQNGLLLRNLI